MNINKLPITDDLQEQIAYGKEIMESYDSKMLEYLHGLYSKITDWDERFPISREEMLCKATYDYYIYGFAPEQQLYYRLWGKTHEQKKEYITQRNSFVYFARLNAKSKFQTFEDKYEAYKLLKPYYKREIIKIETEKDYPEFLDFISRHPKFVVKPLDLHDTAGIELIDTTDPSLDKKQLFSSLVTVAEQFEDNFFMEFSNKKYAVLEEVIEQDTEFGVFSPKSLNIIRIVTIRKGEKIYIPWAYTKFGVSDDLIVGESRYAMLCAINVESGVIETNAFNEKGDEFETHPVCGKRFKGFQFPKWQELLDLLQEIAVKTDFDINYISWDVCLTPKGWVIVEGNFYGQPLWQICYERGMKKEFEDIINWKMDDDKPWFKYKIKQVEKSAGLHD